jgi:hypothetical protein
MLKEKVILDTEVLVKIKVNSNLIAQISDSRMEACVFDFQVLLIQNWQITLRRNKLNHQLRKLKQVDEDIETINEMEQMLSKLNSELEQRNEFFIKHFGDDTFCRLNMPLKLKYHINRFDCKLLREMGIKILVTEKRNFAMAIESLNNYEEVYKSTFSNEEFLNKISYLNCGFAGIRLFLEQKPPHFEKPNLWSTFNLELVKV